MIHSSSDKTLAMLGNKGSGFYVIKLADLFWSGYEMTNEINKAQAYEMKAGASEATQLIAERLGIACACLRIEELTIAVADQIGFAQPNFIHQLPLADWAAYWLRKSEVAKSLATELRDQTT
jgi:hypothetical protein